MPSGSPLLRIRLDCLELMIEAGTGPALTCHDTLPSLPHHCQLTLPVATCYIPLSQSDAASPHQQSVRLTYSLPPRLNSISILLLVHLRASILLKIPKRIFSRIQQQHQLHFMDVCNLNILYLLSNSLLPLDININTFCNHGNIPYKWHPHKKHKCHVRSF